MKTVTCGHDFPHHALGLCKRCYFANYAVNNRDKYRGYGRARRVKYSIEERRRGRAKYAANPEKAANSRLKLRYGITLDDYKRMLEEQKGGCALCQRPPKNKRLAVDHDHKCCNVKGKSCGKCIRGLLCDICNRKIVGMIERWKVDPQRIVAYLQ